MFAILLFGKKSFFSSFLLFIIDLNSDDFVAFFYIDNKFFMEFYCKNSYFDLILFFVKSLYNLN